MVLYWVILYWFYIKPKHIYITFTAPCVKFKIVSLTCLQMKTYIYLLFDEDCSKITCCIAFGSGSSVGCLLKSASIKL